MVRVSCVRSLMKMQANTVPVVAVVQELKNDADPRVRDVVGEALAAFGVAPASPGTSPIQPVGMNSVAGKPCWPRTGAAAVRKLR